MRSFYGKVLTIDLTGRRYDVDDISDDVFAKHLGGKGLATHLLLERNPPGVEPLGPENRLIFAVGPVAGSSVWGSCRYGVFTKSPLTGYYAESYSGGTVAEHMSGSGFDAVVIHGSSKAPVWIEISDQGVYFHAADNLWGMDTYQTEDSIKAWIKNAAGRPKGCGVVCIGPAGENQVGFAVIENDYWRSAGRTGVGAVMGSKNIKAIAFWGRQKREPHDMDRLRDLAKSFAQESKENAVVKAYKSRGTPMVVDIMDEVGGFPTRYWRKGKVEHRNRINAEALHEKCDVKPNACRKCFMACGRLTTVREGRHEGLTVEGPEYETIYAFGGLCEVDSIEEIVYLNDICDRLGMDTITAGNLVGLTIEASRQGKIEHSIDYGEVDAMAELLEDVAARRGIGDVLARGIKFAAKEWDMEEQAIHVKGMEPAGYDPRVLKGMGLAYGTSDRGACHLRATFYKPELSGVVAPDQIEGKAEVFAEWEDRLTLFDALVVCRFYRDLYQWDELSAILKAATGLDLDKDAMRSIAATITDNTRRFNLREGLTPEDDRLPKRFHREPLPETQAVITEDQMETLLEEYYQARGWDASGHPGKET
jgi:aldehyde:ferredoxin oxidoreductase